MREIARIAEAYDLIVISDEIYTAYSYQHPFVPFTSLPGMAERTITLNSFSKDFVMTGWRVGCIVAPQPIIRVVQQINENVVFTAPSMSQRAALYALQHREEVQPALVETFRERMFFAAACINRIPKMHVTYPPKQKAPNRIPLLNYFPNSAMRPIRAKASSMTALSTVQAMRR